MITKPRRFDTDYSIDEEQDDRLLKKIFQED
jgi:hypothetical protein